MKMVHKMELPLLAVLLLFAMQTGGMANSLDALFKGKSLWSISGEQLEKEYRGKGFRWLSNKKDRAMISHHGRGVVGASAIVETGSGKGEPLTICAGVVPVGEVTLDLQKGVVAGVNFSIWNRGDDEKIEMKRFGGYVNKLEEEITAMVGQKPVKKTRGKSGASQAQRLVWNRGATLWKLDSKYEVIDGGEFKAEFIRLSMYPNAGIPLGSDPDVNTAKTTKLALAERVKRPTNGDVYLDSVPMVDQGEKGYCALASAERVFRYYGIECDQHELAQVSGSGKLGTNPQELQETLHKLRAQFRVRVRDLVHWNSEDYVKFTEAYNRSARKVGAKTCPPDYYLATFKGLDAAVLKEARAQFGGYEKFKRHVSQSINNGLPLLWGLELGVFPENGVPPRQAGGGHMRIIIGYNEKKDELIFSDSWGAGHETKRMNLRDAQAVTNGLYVIEPWAR